MTVKGKVETGLAKHPHERHVGKVFVHLLTLILVVHFADHLTWYAFHEWWVHSLGLPDPEQLGHSLGDASAPVVLVVLAGVAWLTELLP